MIEDYRFFKEYNQVFGFCKILLNLKMSKTNIFKVKIGRMIIEEYFFTGENYREKNLFDKRSKREKLRICFEKREFHRICLGITLIIKNIEI